MGNQFEVSGKYNTAKIFTDNIEPEAVAQIISLCNQRAFEGSKIRIMPDVHAGKGCTIGTTMTIVDKVIPNLVGVDIGCGMHVADLGIYEGDIDLAEVDDIIRQYVPAGFSVRGKAHRFERNVDIESMCCYGKIKGSENRILLSVGTLGGGNHFIEIDKDENGRLFLVVHTGSRNLGVAVATYYQNEAWRRLSAKFGKEARDEIITRLKEEGRQSEISAELKNLTATCGVQKEFAYCEGSLFSEYMHDMKIVQEYASWNRRAIVDEILGYLDITAVDVFETIHNYIDIENRILRKGSVSAQKGEKLIIPMNMRDGSLICIGKGNPDWNFSAPHGAGRLMSRSRAKDEISLEDFKESMKGIYTSSVGFGTIDESPMAYKPMESIVSNIGDTVDIIGIIKPVYNFKAGEEGVK